MVDGGLISDRRMFNNRQQNAHYVIHIKDNCKLIRKMSFKLLQKISNNEKTLTSLIFLKCFIIKVVKKFVDFNINCDLISKNF